MCTTRKMEFEMYLLQIMCFLIGLFNCNPLSLASKSTDKICQELSLPNGYVSQPTPRSPMRYFKCDNGFTLYGAKMSSCIERGVWYPEIPKCIKSGCKEPKLDNGKFQIIKSKKYKNALISFKCDDGFRRNGTDIMLCDGRTWSDQAPTCVIWLKPEDDPVECDFEDVYLCGWSQDTNDDFDWTRWSGKTHTNDTGPDTDYTTRTDQGHYVFLETSAQQAGDKANLISMVFQPTYATNECLTFKYHVYGKHVGNLSVFLTPANLDTQKMKDSHRLFHVTGNRSNEWHLGNVSLPNQTTAFKIVIQGTSGGFYGDIALDDVKISKCSEGEILTTEKIERSQTLNTSNNFSSKTLTTSENFSSQTLNTSDNFSSRTFEMSDNSKKQANKMSDNFSATLTNSSSTYEMIENSHLDSKNQEINKLYMVYTEKLTENGSGNYSIMNEINEDNRSMTFQSVHNYNDVNDNIFTNETSENETIKELSILGNEKFENLTFSPKIVVDNVIDIMINTNERKLEFPNKTVEFSRDSLDFKFPNQVKNWEINDTFQIKSYRATDKFIPTEDNINMSITHDIPIGITKVPVGTIIENNIHESETRIDGNILNLNLNKSALLNYKLNTINSEDDETLIHSENNETSTSVKLKEEQYGDFNLSKDVLSSEPNQEMPKVTLENNVSFVNVTTGEKYNSLNENGSRNETYNNDILNISTTALANMQHEDSDLVRVFWWISQRQKPHFESIREENPGLRNLWLNFDLIKIVDGVLCKSRFQLGPRNETVKILLPRSLVKTVLENMWKTESSFVDVTKVFERITASYSWYRIQDDIKLFQLNCTKCQTTKFTFNNYPRNSTDLIYGSPMEKICLRFLGPFSLRETGSRFIFLITDAYSLMTQTYILPYDSYETIIMSLMGNYFSVFGTPLYIHYDQSSPPQRALFSKLSFLLELKQVDKCTCDTQRHAMTEKYVHILIQTISELILDHDSNWDGLFFLLISSFNSHPMPDTGLSPNHLMFGRDHHRPVHVALVDSKQPTSNFVRHIYQHYVLRLDEELDEVVEL